MKAPTVSARTAVAAPARDVYALVSDLPGLARIAEELADGVWLDGVTEPAVGARFRGENRRRWHRWSTVATVTHADPGKCFAFDVAFHGIPVARWRYDIVSTGTGTTCLVEESTWDRRPAWFAPLAAIATGGRDRAEINRHNIEHTLRRLKIVAERGG